jgi:L-lactate dehydrogenase complex protein LldG
MSSRESILTKLRTASGRNVQSSFVAKTDAFTEQPGTNPLARYIELASAEGTSISQVDDWDAVPASICAYIEEQALEPTLVIDSEAPVSSESWAQVGINITSPPLNKDGDIFLSDCFGAIAENGAIVISSGDGHSVADNFLAETHIVLLRRSRIFQGLADLWQVLRHAGPMPREFCLVTGPSRTADLGVPAILGAHGPARVHVLIVDDL